MQLRRHQRVAKEGCDPVAICGDAGELLAAVVPIAAEPLADIRAEAEVRLVVKGGQLVSS